MCDTFHFCVSLNLWFTYFCVCIYQWTKLFTYIWQPASITFTRFGHILAHAFVNRGKCIATSSSDCVSEEKPCSRHTNFPHFIQFVLISFPFNNFSECVSKKRETLNTFCLKFTIVFVRSVGDQTRSSKKKRAASLLIHRGWIWKAKQLFHHRTSNTHTHLFESESKQTVSRQGKYDKSTIERLKGKRVHQEFKVIERSLGEKKLKTIQEQSTIVVVTYSSRFSSTASSVQAKIECGLLSRWDQVRISHIEVRVRCCKCI